jgi:hypothetical protein
MRVASDLFVRDSAAYTNDHGQMNSVVAG